MERADFYAKWSALHGDAPITGAVKGWLTISYKCARIFSALRISPNGLTLVGIFAAAAAWPLSRTWWALLLILFSLFADGVDGSLAIYVGADSVRGALFDSLADRITEAFFLLLFYRLAPGSAAILFIAWALSFTQEYIRARAMGLGNTSTGVVTISERPVRVIILMVAIAGWHLNTHISVIAAGLWLALQTVAITQLVIFQRKSI